MSPRFVYPFRSMLRTVGRVIGQVVDADDVRIVVKGFLLSALGGGVLLIIAAALGVAWAVFRVAGGL